MFYILRHGRTDWNEEHRLQGEVDIPLNETGRQMAYDAAEKYKDIDFDICYCSPLKRAQETARIFLADRNPAVEIITDNRLHEMCFGDYEGVKNIRQKPECPVYLLFEEPEKYVAKDGAESFEELYHRTGEFIEQVHRPCSRRCKQEFQGVHLTCRFPCRFHHTQRYHSQSPHLWC